MGPKKQIKKQAIEQPPKIIEPEIPLHQLQGYGRFNYPSGATYVGEWKLFKGIKCKHGKGTLTVQSLGTGQSGKEMYEGQWVQDKMTGKGTYAYADGSIYKGDWKQNQQCGSGVYEFANGTVYQGDFLNHLMHGTGYFIDHTGKKWGGQFRKGKYQTKNQTQLAKQKAFIVKKNEIKKQIQASFIALLEAVAKSDKKSLKDNLAPFFATADNLKEYIKEPYSKFDERPSQKWTQVISIAKGGQFKVLQSPNQASLIGSDRILAKQMEGSGQFVQVCANKDDKMVKIGVVGLESKRWIIVCVVEQERKK